MREEDFEKKQKLINNFKYIKDNEDPIGNMLIAISRSIGEPSTNIKFKIINTASNIEINPCVKMYWRSTPELKHTDRVDVFHKVGIKWKRMDCLEYPNNNWTWQEINN